MVSKKLKIKFEIMFSPLIKIFLWKTMTAVVMTAGTISDMAM